MIDEPDVRLELVTAACPPGGELTGAFVIPGGPPPETKRVELSVLWHTSGKGTEDLGVIHYEAWTVDDRTLETMPNPGTFTVRLPLTPWSYDGTLIKIHWLARVRMRWEDEGNTRELVREAEFTLSPRLG